MQNYLDVTFLIELCIARLSYKIVYRMICKAYLNTFITANIEFLQWYNTN